MHWPVAAVNVLLAQHAQYRLADCAAETQKAPEHSQALRQHAPFSSQRRVNAHQRGPSGLFEAKKGQLVTSDCTMEYSEV